MYFSVSLKITMEWNNSKTVISDQKGIVEFCHNDEISTVQKNIYMSKLCVMNYNM